MSEENPAAPVSSAPSGGEATSTTVDETTGEASPDFAGVLAATWQSLPIPDLPDSTAGQTVVWTGEEMIVWGGWPTDQEEPSGWALELGTERWRQIPSAPIERVLGHAAVWTGEEMIVWGGSGGPEGSVATDLGAAFDPVDNTWRVLAESPLEARKAHSAVWTGSEMIIVGGYDDDLVPLKTVAAYNPASNEWRVLPETPIESGLTRFEPGQSAVWTGSSLIVYGGDELSVLGDEPLDAVAASYDPTGDSWSVLEGSSLNPRIWHSAVWTGDEMIVWGGSGPNSSAPDGLAFDPAQNTWRALPAAPITERSRHTAVWTGDVMIIMGGSPIEAAGSSERIGQPIAYDPTGDRWLEIDAPPIHGRTTASIWTGDSVAVWSGNPVAGLVLTLATD